MIGKGPKLRRQAADLVETAESAVRTTEQAVADVADDVSQTLRATGEELTRAAAIVAVCAQLIAAAVLAAAAIYAMRVSRRMVT